MFLFFIKLLCFVGIISTVVVITTAAVAFTQSPAGLLAVPVAALIGLLVFGYVAAFAEDRLATK